MFNVRRTLVTVSSIILLLLVVWMSPRPCDTSVNQAVPESETDSNPSSQLGKKTGEIGL